MIVLKSISETRNKMRQLRLQKGLSVGLVPTMGALHEGHLSLVNRSRQENDITIATVYVNPVQFNNPEDFKTYPVQQGKDLKMLKDAGCHYVFIPSQKEMYPNGAEGLAVKMDFGPLSELMEGQHRPGHFSGVGIVVSKLLHIVEPDRVYFGQKDLQQFLIIRKMVEDLSMPFKVVCCPTVREKDGLAMSSRNQRLTPGERQKAPLLYQALTEAKRELLAGKPITQVKIDAQATIEAEPAFQLEYFEVVDAQTLALATEETPMGEMAICVAAHLGKARLIDNLLLG